MRPEYGPTLGRMLAPRWHAAPRLVRGGAVCAGLMLLAAGVGLVLTLESAHLSRGGPVPFGFSYKALYRVAPDPGGYVKVTARAPDGALRYSYAVGPLRLPPYSGGITGELPRYAASYVAALGARDRGFVLRGEGKTRVNTVPGYQVLYTASIEGREMLGRDVLLLPPKSGVREGVAIEMLTSPGASAQVKTPSDVASTGVLLRPLKTFTFE